ncbi:bifunctional demethylmenaquinone methyltransferase/2-methoxy-6-polyprenyl-1,4-benzoquinol methylase UbiE [Synechococcus sp. PCC 7336]|uniref:bifunctional demethylmenaquinone methyltransferase/2-methoxy-6-polyprenyl-1,4-benzoquinol methylase UbiE n=1 Tax=Synechococcus sp. PCC 7336 TaxID=195250 RepID=UPI0003481F47|nr:bifunctional demethylmenaquinone methyltransferase/2-methoxy-6-polyprenyl-1,4-benzoquinol methylase UbiE [Synechococcus sp. PCC 7336]
MPSSTVQSVADVRDLFDRIAPQYDRLNDWLSLGLHRVWKGMAVGWAQPPQGGTVLDLCCGSGDLALQLARAVGPSGRIVGVDVSEQLLAIARRRSQRAGDRAQRGQLDWICADALHLPFAENSFDAATVGYGLRNLTDIPQALRELRRVLVPGARAAILDFQRLDFTSSHWMAEFQQLYLDAVVVPAAASLGLQQEYEYIQQSLANFPTAAEQGQLAIAAGFEMPQFYDLAGGLMGILVLAKPAV